METTILVIEDNDILSRAIHRHLQAVGHRTLVARSLEQARICIAESEKIHLILADVTLPDGTSFELADELAASASRVPIIIMTADDRASTAVEALHRKVADFLLKPFSLPALDAALARVLPSADAAAGPHDGSAASLWRSTHAPAFVGRSPLVEQAFAVVERVADTDCTVLITGESGTGKELFARAVHSASGRSAQPFVTLNCATLPENLVESELFGHARGAFTGAIAAREGRFLAANHGTLLLDEIGELTLAVQAKLLRVLQEKVVTAVGEERSQAVDVRVIAATNRDLEDMVERKVFREDLFYRVNVIPIELPPLRDRREDIPQLVEHFIQRTSRKRGRRVEGISRDALDALCAADWPGNVRQLENLVERMVVLRSEGVITVDDLPAKMRHAGGPRTSEHAAVPPAASDTAYRHGATLRELLDEAEQRILAAALQAHDGNKSAAARALQVERSHFHKKLKQHGLGA